MKYKSYFWLFNERLWAKVILLIAWGWKMWQKIVYWKYVTKKCDTKEKCDKKRERKCDKKCDNIGLKIVVYQGVLDEKMRHKSVTKNCDIIEKCHTKLW